MVIETLEEAQSWLAAIVDSSDDAIISKDLGGRITSWNPGATRMFGYTPDEMIGVSILKIIPPERRAEEDEILAKIRAGDRFDHYETVRLAKDGRQVEVSITASPIRDRAGRIVGASKIARDISSHREEQRRKDNFLAVLAHELRNPLSPILTAVSLLKLPGVAEEQRRAAERIIERQVRHMSRLLDDLQDISRIARDRVELNKSKVELHALILDVVDAARPTIEAKGQELKISIPDGPIWLNADPVRITQIISNLLSNAAKYTPHGGRVELCVDVIDAEARISVKDNGIGISPGMMPSLFTMFWQGHPSLNRPEGGLGIGLALVREFVEKHEGSVEVRSDGPDRGSEFVVRLPLLGDR